MAEKTLGPEFLIHGGGLDLVFPHHENERAQSQAVGRPFAKIWMHNGLLRFTGEKMSKSVGNVATIQDVIAEWGREAALLFLMTGHWRKPLEFSEEAMTAAGVAGREPAQRAARRDARSGRLGRVRGRARRRLQHARRARRSSTAGPARARSTSCAAGSPIFGLGGLGDSGRGARRRSSELARARAEARAGARLRRVGSAARRDRGRRLGGAGRGRRARRLRARAALVTRELVYGRNAVREALRGRREVLELWVSERAAASLDWLGEGPRPQVVKERELTEAAGEPRPPGRRRLGGPVPVCRSVGARRGTRRRCSPASTRSPTRATSAPSIRSAAGAGATG